MDQSRHVCKSPFDNDWGIAESYTYKENDDRKSAHAYAKRCTTKEKRRRFFSGHLQVVINRRANVEQQQDQGDKGCTIAEK